MTYKQNEQILSLLFSISQMWKEKIHKEKSSVLSLNFTQIEILHYIRQNHEIAVKNLAKYLRITPPSTTVAINSMVKLGLAKRFKGKKDRRITFISITEKGKKFLDAKHKKRDEIIKKILGALNQKEKNII